MPVKKPIWSLNRNINKMSHLLTAWRFIIDNQIYICGSNLDWCHCYNEIQLIYIIKQCKGWSHFLRLPHNLFFMNIIVLLLRRLWCIVKKVLSDFFYRQTPLLCGWVRIKKVIYSSFWRKGVNKKYSGVFDFSFHAFAPRYFSF